MVNDVTCYWKDTYRAVLASLSCEAVGGNPDDTEDISLSITLLAAGLGIHDDIIDRSKDKHFRRTIFGTYGLDNSLLTGELYIVKALAATRNLIIHGYPPDKVAFVLDALEQFFIEVWEGEYLETLCRKEHEN